MQSDFINSLYSYFSVSVYTIFVLKGLLLICSVKVVLIRFVCLIGRSGFFGDSNNNINDDW